MYILKQEDTGEPYAKINVGLSREDYLHDPIIIDQDFSFFINQLGTYLYELAIKRSKSKNVLKL